MPPWAASKPSRSERAATAIRVETQRSAVAAGRRPFATKESTTVDTIHALGFEIVQEGGWRLS
jgi:hypothetical protein